MKPALPAAAVRGWPLQGLAGLLLMVLLAGSGAAWGDRALQALQGWQRGVVEWLGDEFTVLRFGLLRQRSEDVLQLVVTTRRHVVVGERILTPDPRGTAQASTLPLQGLQGPLVALIVVWVWPLAPGRQVAEAVLRGVLVLPAGLALATLDAPVVLLASIWDLVHDHLAPGRSNGLTVARDLLRGGGRWGVGLVIGATAVLLAARLLRLPQPAAQGGGPQRR